MLGFGIVKRLTKGLQKFVYSFVDFMLCNNYYYQLITFEENN